MLCKVQYTLHLSCNGVVLQIAQLVNHAKNLHEEEKYIVRTHGLNKDTIW